MRRRRVRRQLRGACGARFRANCVIGSIIDHSIVASRLESFRARNKLQAADKRWRARSSRVGSIAGRKRSRSSSPSLPKVRHSTSVLSSASYLLILNLLNRVASTLHILNGRFAESVALESSEESAGTAEQNSTPGLDDKTPSPSTQSESSDAATARMAALKRETAQEAATWLSRVCAHVGVRLDQLPDALGPDVKLPLPAPSEGQSTSQEQRQWDTVWELVLVSLGLVGTSAPTAKDEPSGYEKEGSGGGGQRDRCKGEADGEKNLASKLGSKVGSLFSSGPSSSTPSSSSPNAPPPDTGTSPPSSTAPPPLNYTALSRSLLVRTFAFLSIPESLLTDVEHTIAQFLFFQLQERNQGSSSDSTAARQETDKARDRVGWDTAAREYRERAAKKGNALKWAATGAGFVLGGVAIGLTGGAYAWMHSDCLNLHPSHEWLALSSAQQR